MSAKTKKTAIKKKSFLARLAQVGVVAKAVKEARVSKATVYRWRTEDPAFAEDWDKVTLSCIKILEDSFYERAVKGDNTAGIMWLNGHAPEKYKKKFIEQREDHHHHHTHKLDFASLSHDERDKLRDLLARIGSRA